MKATLYNTLYLTETLPELNENYWTLTFVYFDNPC